jgi:hypothetical protein
MSFDLYLYQSKSGIPDIREANEVLAYKENSVPDPGAKEMKRQIINALLAFNPKLEIFDPSPGDHITSQEMILDNVLGNECIELNPPEEDYAIQISVYDQSVAFGIPYWYSGEEANKVFKLLCEYVKKVNEVSGYFIYDPQSGNVGNPQEMNVEELIGYVDTTDSITNNVMEIIRNKPWWKFW